MHKQQKNDDAFKAVFQQQEQFVELIFNEDNHHSYSREGMEIYRHNLKATATQALAISFPTVHTLIGEDLFSFATERLLLQNPPQHGDWGLWGYGFADVLQELPQLDDYPYVADCARLDLAIHQIEKRKNPVFDAASAHLLTDIELDDLYIQPSDTVLTLASDYPIIELWHIHYSDSSEQYTERFKERIAETGFRQYALVYRPNYKAQIQELERSEYQWFNLLMEGKSIGHALDLIDTEDFRLEQWLPRAIEKNCIERFYQKAS
jgi:hypothetical protein